MHLLTRNSLLDKENNRANIMGDNIFCTELTENKFPGLYKTMKVPKGIRSLSWTKKYYRRGDLVGVEQGDR